jgi:hypothetical protein
MTKNECNQALKECKSDKDFWEVITAYVKALPHDYEIKEKQPKFILKEEE